MNYSTYCPEDNKLRLYVGRVPRDEYEKLRAEGWTSTPKQDCDFVAAWTPNRRDTAQDYSDSGLIEDEDQTPEDRAADRAERFGEYRDKRTEDATGHADRYESGSGAHGYQSERRAERAAARHDRIGGRACDAWSKAEYWTRRTAGVISHALHRSSPAVRMGRIKEIEAELRQFEKGLTEYRQRFELWTAIAAEPDAEKQNETAKRAAYFEHGEYVHPRTGRKSYLFDFTAGPEGSREPDPLNGVELAALWLSRHGQPATETEWTRHLKLRLAYENQMLEAQGGRAAFVEMEVGGWLGSHQIRKVNKSPATGRVVSVTLKQPGTRWDSSKPGFCLIPYNVERLPSNVYRPPSAEDKAALAAEKKAEKASKPAKAPCPLVNPTDAEAERLQGILNAAAKADHCARHQRSYGRDYAEDFKPSTVLRITQAQYSAASKGAHARAETRGLCKNGVLEPRFSNMWTGAEAKAREERGPKVCEIRTTSGNGSDYGARRVIILSDKPQKPLPSCVWPAPDFALEMQDA